MTNKPDDLRARAARQPRVNGGFARRRQGCPIGIAALLVSIVVLSAAIGMVIGDMRPKLVPGTIDFVHGLFSRP